MRKFWTEEEDQILTEKYPHMFTEDLLKLLDRTIYSIYGRANLLGLSKSEDFMKNEYWKKVNDNLKKVGEKHRFIKGSISWNKGKKGVCTGGESTQFKKGQLPVNTKTDGHISVRRNSQRGTFYKYIRLANAKWQQLHQYIWEQNHGKIKRGYIVVFKDRNPMNCVIENLELISLKENMSRNTLSQWPPEIKDTIKTLSKLKKQITHHEK